MLQSVQRSGLECCVTSSPQRPQRRGCGSVSVTVGPGVITPDALRRICEVRRQGFVVRARFRALCGSTPAAQSAGVVNPDGHGAGSAGRGRELPVPRHPHQGQEGEGHGVQPRARRGYKEDTSRWGESMAIQMFLGSSTIFTTSPP